MGGGLVSTTVGYCNSYRESCGRISYFLLVSDETYLYPGASTLVRSDAAIPASSPQPAVAAASPSRVPSTSDSASSILHGGGGGGGRG